MTLKIYPDMTKEEARFVDDRLTEFSDQFTQPRNYREISLALRDRDGEIFGGLTGSTVWDWLHTSVLWVSEDLRGQGYGAGLLESAEEIARERGCKNARLHTFEFQAREFYEAQGYRVASQTDDFPAGHTQYLMTKKLWRN